MSCKLEPTVWSHDTGQQMPCFDRCQLTITWMSISKMYAVNQGYINLGHLISCSVATVLHMMSLWLGPQDYNR